MYKCCIHILGCLLIWAIASSAQAASQQIHIDDPRFIKNPPAHILEKFTLDEDGYIIDGPRQADGEPIDHSILLSNQEIINNFLKVAFGGSELSHKESGYKADQETIAFTRGIKKIEREIQIVYMNGIAIKRAKESLFVLEHIEFAMSLISEQTGIDYEYISIDDEDGRDYNTVEFQIYLMLNDQHALAISEEINNHLPDYNKDPRAYNIVKKLSQSIKASTIDRERTMDHASVMPIYSHKGKINNNLFQFYLDRPPLEFRGSVYEEFIQSMGLYRDDDRLNFSMFTDSFKNYNYPTEQDIWMLRILYDDRLKHGMTKEEALPIIYALIDDIRPYGKN